MVEVLVSILIMAAGVIGTAGMQLAAMRTAQQTAFHDYAWHLASEIADSIRASEEWRVKHAADNPFVGARYDAALDPDLDAPGQLCYVDSCDPGAFAAFELFEWKTRLKRALPEARLLICRDAAPWSDANRSLTWDCADDAGAPIAVKLHWRMKNPDGSVMANGGNGGSEDSPAIVLPIGAGM